MRKRFTDILSEEEINRLAKLQGTNDFFLYWTELEKKYSNVLFPDFGPKGSFDNDPEDVA